jgi:hypothetical protein
VLYSKKPRKFGLRFIPSPPLKTLRKKVQKTFISVLTKPPNGVFLSLMLRATPKKANRNRRRVKYVGIVSDAAALAVSREHLWQVLSGRRESKSLLARYSTLKRGQMKEAA